MANFGKLQQDVSVRLLDPSNTAVSLSIVSDAINDAISYWKFRRFWFNEVYDNVFLTARDGVIPNSPAILVPLNDDDGFNIEYSAQRYPLRKITQQQYDGMYMSNGYGQPWMYSRIGQDYVVYPLPDRDYQLNRHYLKEYGPLLQLTDENDFTVYAPRLITLWSLANLSAELRQDDKMEAYYRGAASDEYRNLRVMGDKSNGSGKLTLHSLL